MKALSTDIHAIRQRATRARRKKAKECINGATHGPAIRGTRCVACWKARAETGSLRAAAVVSIETVSIEGLEVSSSWAVMW
jgi:hypothetical protein